MVHYIVTEISTLLSIIKGENIMKKRIFLKILLLGGVMIGLIGCGEKRGSRDWIENKVAEVSRVYPTENLFDLFKQFPDVFTRG